MKYLIIQDVSIIKKLAGLYNLIHLYWWVLGRYFEWT